MLAALIVSEEKPLLVEVSDFTAQRTAAQNRLLHAILRDVADSLEVNGQRFGPDAWKEIFRRKFIGTREVTLPTGEIIEFGISTTSLNVEQMAEAITKFEVWLSAEFGYLAELAA